MKKIMKRFKDNMASKRGMTLVEVLVAMSILMIIIFTFTPLFAQYYRNIRQSGELTRKTYEKASLIERLLSNRDSDNKGAYETYNVGVPLELYVKNSSNTTLKTLDFHTKANSNYVSKVEGNMVTTDGDKSNSGNEYTTIYLGSTSQRLIAFPKALTDDFIEKEVMVVPIGFPEDFDISKFHVYYTDENGNWQTHELTKGEYYNVEDATDGDVPCAKFTFYGANEVVCFDNSPLVITYNSHQVEIEIIAPKIIMVGEKASDNNYYYYATSGVDTRTGRMDLIAKESANLTSAMNDVEWVDKGEGDNGKGGVNTYGYYIMGGDAGQVRRFWQKKDINASSTSENYTWGGDTLYQYDRYYYITGDNQADASSYENITKKENQTQAAFKNVFRSNLGRYDFNGVDDANSLTESDKITIGFDYYSITANYYTANATSDNRYTTVGRIMALKLKSGNEYRYAGNTTELNGTASSASYRESTNNVLFTWLDKNNPYASTLNASGFRTATNYPYQSTKGYTDINGNAADDDSLITITSVGAVQINTSNSNYTKSTQNSVLGQQLYPTQSYSLYCGYIPAVIDIWGWKTKNILSTYNNYSMLFHTGTLGIATNGSSWYPVGKFGDTHTSSITSEATSNTLSQSIFGNKTSWSALLNYGTNPDVYPFGTTYSSHYITEHDGDYWEGVYDHHIVVKYYYRSVGFFTTKWNEATYDVIVTNRGQNDYTSPRNTNNTFGASVDASHPITIVKNEIRGTDGVWRDDPVSKWEDLFDKEGGGVGDLLNDKYIPREANDDNTAKNTTSGTKYRTWKMKQTEVVDYNSDSLRYYGPTGSGSDYVTTPSAVNNATLTNRSFLGTALPNEGNDYYITSGQEVDVTVGYLSQPYAISVNKPVAPNISGLSGSDYYFKKYGSNITSSKFDHSFFNAGLRDFITMLDIKSFRDELTGNNISLAVGYTLSLIANDYDYCTRLGQVMNTGIVYIRATGDGTGSDTAGSLESGKGWSLKKESNVFHQFYGIDQYQNSSGTSTALGWDTQYHRAYFNLAGDDNALVARKTKTPAQNISPNTTEGSTNFGTNCHPLAQTTCTTVNWGQTWDEKPQAMWGTENGTLLSWFYDYEEVQSGTYTNSKITGVRKEFESYMWADRYGSVVDNHYDYATGKVTGSGDNQKVSYNNTNGFISVLDSVNSVYFGDSYWVAVGNCSMKNPANYCQSGKGNYTASGSGTYINVKSTDDNNTYKWTAVKVSTERINFVSVEYCEGIWYAMGYKDNGGSAGASSDKAGNGIQDPGEEGVIFYATNPTIADLDSDPDYMSGGGYFSGSYTGGWRQALTRAVGNSYTKETTVMKRQADSWKSFVFEGANSMASQG
ncbi:MAG: prepilin-type N-terminal cleavage/methylation domain-containing protein [Ruminococcaceae bacterium]|nr:prepilin-type N-terminal cleavage/methylation domain-containing protein [Oscillospiraceae bacterium]